MLVLGQSRGSLPQASIGPHGRAMGRFVARVHVQHPQRHLQRGPGIPRGFMLRHHLQKRILVERLKPVAFMHYPIIMTSRQKPPLIQVHTPLQSRRARDSPHRRFEGLHIHLNRAGKEELHRLMVGLQRIHRFETAPDAPQRGGQGTSGAVKGASGPEHLGQSLAIQPPPPIQQQISQQRLGFGGRGQRQRATFPALGPGRLLPNFESPQHDDMKTRRHRLTSCFSAPADKESAVVSCPSSEWCQFQYTPRPISCQ